MPVWLQWTLWVAAGIIAAGTIWTKALRPIMKLVATAEVLVPLLREMRHNFEDVPNIFPFLVKIAAEFKSDSGSTLKDSINRIEKAAHDAQAAAHIVAAHLEVTKALDQQDRVTVANLETKLDQLVVEVSSMRRVVAAANGLPAQEPPE